MGRVDCEYGKPKRKRLMLTTPLERLQIDGNRDKEAVFNDIMAAL